MKAYLKLQHGGHSLGTLQLELRPDVVPKTVRNFVHFLENDSYKNSLFHRIIPGFMAQGGDFVKGDGTGSVSLYGTSFDDENFVLRHDRPGTLSMANSGPHTNGCQFFVTFRPTPHLDGKHVVFGYVVDSEEVLRALEHVRTNRGDRPLEDVTVVDCGIINQETAKETVDEAEIALDDDNEEGARNESEAPEEEPIEEEDEEDDEEEPKTKAEAIRWRMRKLKKKMNQARQLNQRAVKEEAAKLTGQKPRKVKTAVTHNADVLDTAARAGVAPSALTQPAGEALHKAQHRAAKDELQQFGVNDYYNPQGQHRNYERNVKSLPQHHDVANGATYNPLDTTADPERERQGAQRLAAELHRRIDKKQAADRKHKEKESLEGDDETGYINQRNKRFNQKLNRTYDKYTAEIRQNLERGTAL